VAISLKWSEDSKIPMAFFTEMKKNNTKLSMEAQKTWRRQINPEIKDKC
jgi:hypothetical protein